MRVVNFPLVCFVTSFAGLWLSTHVGALLDGRLRPLAEQAREDYNIVVTATLTLLALIVSFSFSMAVSRYDQRKNYEEEEANAIGTEYVRAELLPAADAVRIRDLLRAYTRQRVAFYTTRELSELSQINELTTHLQEQMWSSVESATTAKPSPITSLVASGMNDVLNSQGYTQAAWRNHIPTAAWALMLAIAVCSCLLVGYGARRTGTGLLLILPLVLAISFFLIADIDSPRRGMIRVYPENLLGLAQSLHAY
jgi:hypothetical protein